MLTYELKKLPGQPLYEALYRALRDDILSGKLPADYKLPSKRALSDHLEISKITVENAYGQLLAEGLIRSAERTGYFVEPVHRLPPVQAAPAVIAEAAPALTDLTGGAPVGFPFSVWSRLQREVLRDLGDKLLQPVPNQGLFELRQAIADHLAQFRGMVVDPDSIIIGAGTDFLYNLAVQLLGTDKLYALEEPGYSKIRQIYRAAGAVCTEAQMDHSGVIPDSLGKARVLHLSPSHHFPTGIITPMSRRQELLHWVMAAPGRFIIEDDYDSEFRVDARPMRSIYALNSGHGVIYMNTFSKTLAPSIRIGYMLLPPELKAVFREKLGFYSCTVSSFEQHTLARFISRGFFEQHIGRMRKSYRTTRDKVLSLIEKLPFKVTVLEENAGLHFIVKTSLTDEELEARCREAGFRVRTLSSFYHGPVPDKDRGCIVVSYAGLTAENLEQFSVRLEKMQNEKCKV